MKYLNRWYIKYSLSLVIMLLTCALYVASRPVIGSNTLYIFMLPVMILVSMFLGAGPAIFGMTVGFFIIEIVDIGRIELSLSFIIRFFIVSLTIFYVGHIVEKLRVSRLATEIASNNLRKSEERFRRLIEASTQIVWVANSSGEIIEDSPSWRKFTGRSYEQGKGWGWLDAIHPEDRRRLEVFWRRTLRIKKPFHIEFRQMRYDGEYRCLSSRAVPVYNSDGSIREWIGMNIDITEDRKNKLALIESEKHLKFLNENLENLVNHRTSQVRELAKALSLAEQKQRQNLSTILHEVLQQTLFAVKARFSLLKQTINSGTSDTINEDITELEKLTTQAINTTNKLAIEFNPPILKNEGLAAALKWLVFHVESYYGIKISLGIEEPLTVLPDEERILIVNLTRELLYNVAEHAETVNASLHAYQKKSLIVIEVIDNGTGFDLNKVKEKAREKDRFGLFSVEERLHLFGGKLDIESSPGKGTRVKMSFPYNAAQGRLGVG